MLELRYPWVWWALGWLLVAGVTVGSLMPGDYLSFLEHFSIRDKALHALAYFALMLWFAGLYPRDRHWLVAVLIFLLGLAIDLAQGATATRTFDLDDVAANASGILIGFVLAWFLFAGWCRRVEQLLVR